MRKGQENYFIFGNVNTADYDVYCSGGGTYNAPSRDVDSYHVLGRNGDLMVDHGSYKNMDVTYPCWIARGAPDKVDAFRQALCALRGYQKIIDPYHPDEYRMGIYVDAFAPNMMNARNDSMEMDIVFNCKPQRFLAAGDVPVSVSSGQTLTNPTLYTARPQLQAYGSGNIRIGSDTITINNVPLGNVVLVKNKSTRQVTIDADMFNSGDAITASGVYVNTKLDAKPSGYARIESVALTETTSEGMTLTYENGGSYARLKAAFPQETFTAGTSKTITATYTAEFSIYLTSSAQYVTATATITIKLQYAAGAKTFTLTPTVSITGVSAEFLSQSTNGPYYREISVDSSKSANSAPTYIDLEIGEAWINEGSSIAEVNDIVDLPDELPALQPGNNTITFDSSITRLDIVPRWWMI